MDNINNKHAAQEKGITHKNHACDINVSRTIGNSQNWFGCGYLVKSGISIDHKKIRFPYYSMVFVVEGKGTYIDSDGKPTELSSGTIFHRRPGHLHSTFIDQSIPWKEYYLDCNQDLFERLVKMININTNQPIIGSVYIGFYEELFKNLIKNINNSTQIDVFNVYIQFLSLLNDVVIETKKKGNLDLHIEHFSLDKITKDFERLYKDRFELRSYCDEKGIQYETFRKLFKLDFGMSPQQYLIKRRMNEACKLLQCPSLTIKKISYELGYVSPYEFSKHFKRYYHMSPKAYRTTTKTYYNEKV